MALLKMKLKRGNETVCRICSRLLPVTSLGRHLKAQHFIGIEEYKLEIDHQGQWPKCACGCSQPVDYNRKNGRFNRMLGNHRGGSRYSSAMRRMWRDMGRNDRRRRLRKIGDSLIRRMKTGTVRWSTGTYTSTKTGRTIEFQSSWELRHLVDLDSDPSVVTFDYEPMSLSYFYQRRKRNYWPDFKVRYVDGRTEFHEVGPRQLKLGKGQQGAKTRALITFCQENGFGCRIIDFTVNRASFWRNWVPDEVRHVARRRG